MLSVIIPSYRDPLLNKTIESILQNFEGEFEIVVVYDGYWGTPIDDPRVRYVHLGKNRGMRGAINAGVLVSQGEYIMRTDEHCMFGKGFDKIILKDIKDNEIVTARRFFLDPVKWEVMDLPPVDYEKLKIQDCGNGVRKFAGVESKGDDKQPIQESFGMQGSCWIMKRTWWDSVIGSLQTDGYGPHYQDSHEMVFKTWKAGGKLMFNKNTWYAHKHRSFPRTHNEGSPENPTNREAGWAYSLKVWEPYYNEVLSKWTKNNM